MSYRIVVEETEETVKKVGKDWMVVGQSQKPQGDQFFASNDYGYTPEIEKTVEVTTKIYEQTVVYLNLEAVIRAVNSIVDQPSGEKSL